MNKPRTRALIAAVVVLGLSTALAGCSAAAPEPSSSPTALAPASETPTPTLTPTAVPGAGVRQQVLDGDCQRVMTETELRTATSIRFQRVDRNPLLDLFTASSANQGGINCQWLVEGGSANGGFLSLVILPATVMPGASETRCLGEAEVGCSFTSAVGAYTVSGHFEALKGQSSSLVKKSVARIVDEVQESVGSLPAPAPIVVAVGTWKKLTCAKLEAIAQVAASVKSPGLKVSAADTGISAEGAFTAARASGFLTCSWQQAKYPTPKGQVSGFSVSLLPGAGWVEPTIEGQAGARSLTLADVTTAIAVTGAPADDSFSVNAFDGTNWMRVDSTFTDQKHSVIYPVVSAVSRALATASE